MNIMQKNREVKFRAWHIKGECFVDWLTIQATFLDQAIQVVKKQKITDVHSAEYRLPVEGIDKWIYGKFNIFESSDFKLMQYTGLVDKNGKEIYEGDIVKGVRYEESDEYIKSKVEFVCMDYINSFYLSDIVISLSPGTVRELQLEVIGNIYQNPELLEDESAE